jgi:serine/threonine protein kinase
MNQGDSPGAGQLESSKLPPAVFISHSSEDSSAAEGVCVALEAAGIHCWIAPRDVLAGRPYSGQITEAIRRTEILLVVLSQASNRSKQVLREVERAAHFKVDLLAFKIESVEPLDDLAYFLGVEHWLDGSKPGPLEQHFPSLVRNAIELLNARKRQSPAQEQSSRVAEPEAERFAHFRILRRPDGSLFRLGKGGMGVTYKAIDTRLDKPVALKVIGAELLNSPQARRRFLREAQTAAKIDHPNVATVLYFGEEGDTYFYAMQFVNGEDLERYVERLGALSPAIALRVTMQVAKALEAADDQELIHRDIKPGNIMAIANRSGSLDVKLIDFGLARAAKAAGLDVTQLTGTRDFVGSPAFASPEQAEMSELDTRSDIYSLGVTLWYLLSAKRPFSGTVGQVIIAHAVRPPPFEQLAGVPLPVIDLLRRMLAKSREDRPQNPRQLQEEIETVITKLAAEFSPSPGQIAPASAPVAPEAAPPADDNLELATLLPAVASPSFDHYFGIQIGSLLGDRYRLIEEEREGTGGRLFRATEEKALSGTTAEVALKLLHPGISTDPSLIDLLDNELGVIRNVSHPNLLQYRKLEKSEAPFLVREWIHGFPLSDLLRWRRSLSSSELLMLLEPLAATLDFVSGQGFGLVNVSAQKILVCCPAEISRETFPALARGNAGQWSNCSLKLNPLCIAPLLLRNRAEWGRQTLVPASRVLSMTQAEAGIRGTKSVWLFGRLIYELLSGHDLPSHTGPNEPNKYSPLPELSEEGNQTLRRACVGAQLTGGFPNCAEFWRALKENIAGAGRPANVPVSLPVTPTPPALPPTPPPAPPRKGRLMVGVVLGGVLLIASAIFGAIRFGGSGSTTVVPTPTPSVAAVTPVTTPSPATSVAPVVVATPTPSKSGLALATPASTVALATPAPSPNPAPTTSATADLILRILKAMETHDYRTLLIYTLDKETDYFGHKNSSSAFIQQDMTQDARSYKWCRFVPDLSTFETSLGHDSIEYDSDALDVRGKEHKARCRLDIYYSATTSPRLQALSLKVLRN